MYELLSALATQATISIKNAKLYQQVRQHAEQLETRISERTQQLRQLNQQLEQASRHKSEFLANMSHELRTPMNAIIGFTKLVMRRSKEQLPQKQYENLQKSLSSAEHLLTLINQILDLSKIEAGRLEVYPAMFRLETVIEECIRTVEPMIKPEYVELSSNVAGDLPELDSDRDKLKQIVLNLLSNAIKFTERGQIRLEAKGEKEWIAIDVADTGPGIPREKFDFIFEEFRQVGRRCYAAAWRHRSGAVDQPPSCPPARGRYPRRQHRWPGLDLHDQIPGSFSGDRGNQEAISRRGCPNPPGVRCNEKDPDRRGCRIQQGPAHAVARGRIRADCGNGRPSGNCRGGTGAAGPHSHGSVASCDRWMGSGPPSQGAR